MIYVPKHFSEPDRARMHRLMRNTPFATLISSTQGDLQVTHLPVLLDDAAGPNGTLTGHLARANPHWQALTEGRHLVVFQGPHRYISPAWYQHHPSVPTWNYAVVHASGSCSLIQDATRLHALTAAMTEHFERGNGTNWRLPDDPIYLDGMVKNIVGFEMRIDTLQGKFKLSQNRPAADRARVLEALRASPAEADRELLDLMAPPDTSP